MEINGDEFTIILCNTKYEIRNKISTAIIASHFVRKLCTHVY